MKSISKLLVLFFLFTIVFKQNASAQSFNPFYGNIVSECLYDSIQKNVVDFVNFGVKEVGTPANANALNWLINKYQSYGYTDIKIDTFSYASIFAYNLIVTKTGMTYPDKFVIVDGHYDTKNGPGANDNGSGTSIILEIARLLKDVTTEFSVKFIHFSAEEVGLIGSSHYVNNIVIPQNMDIKILLNIDEVGGVNGMTNNTIVCERDENNNPSTNNVASANYTDTLAQCMQLYSNLNTEISYAYSSDYMPFQGAGKIITGLYEKNQSPYPHTPNDVVANMDMNYVFEVAKGTIGATLYFAVASDTNTSVNIFENNSVKIYPNPATDYFTIDFKKTTDSFYDVKLINVLGELIFSDRWINSKNSINIAKFPSGIYSLIIDSKSERFSTKIVIK
ncbi:MAG: M28 family peptidase [Flavobacteriales bacterium]